MKRDESRSPSLFTFRSHLAVIHRHWYYESMTALLPWAQEHDIQRLHSVLCVVNVSNNLGNLPSVRS